MRYLVFAFDTYYPIGGMNDFQGQFETKEQVKKEIKGILQQFTWVQVVDKETMTIDPELSFLY